MSRSPHRTPQALAALALAVTLAAPASAQEPGQAPPPPPGYQQAPAQGQLPPGYGPPPSYAPPPGYYAPPGYAPAPGGAYGYPPPGAARGPKRMDYEDGDPVPEGYHRETRIRKGLVIGGSVTLGSLWLLSALTASAVGSAQGSGSSRDDYDPLYVPGLGPFITISTAGSRDLGTFVLVLDGLAQSAGIAMTVVGLAAPKTSLVRDDVEARLSPIVVGDGTMGFGIVGSM